MNSTFPAAARVCEFGLPVNCLHYFNQSEVSKSTPSSRCTRVLQEVCSVNFFLFPKEGTSLEGNQYFTFISMQISISVAFFEGVLVTNTGASTSINSIWQASENLHCKRK